MRGKIRAKVLIYVKLIFLIAGGGECTGRLQNCYMDAGIDPTGGINPNITWYFDDIPSDRLIRIRHLLLVKEFHGLCHIKMFSQAA